MSRMDPHTGTDPPNDRHRLPAAVTVFFTLITTMILALLLGILESARTEASRLNLTIAVNSSIDSLFSQYHRDLWDDYRIFGLEYYSTRQLSDEMQDFMQPYIDADNWFPARIDGITISDVVNITDDNGEIFETEVLDYMKYGIAAVIWDLAQAEYFDSGLTQGEAVDYIAELYDSHAVEAADIEYSLENLSDIITSSEEAVSKARSAASDYNGSGFIRYANQAIAWLKKIPSAVSDYEEKANALAESLASSRTELNEKKSSGEISDDVWQSLDSSISQYESYVDEDGDRRQTISALSSASQDNISFLEELIEEAEDIIEYIDDWEPDDEDDELNESRLWRPVIRALRGYDSLDMGCQYGIADSETETALENTASLLNTAVLTLVLPDGADLSTTTLDLDDAPSNTSYGGSDTSGLSMTDRIYMAAYTGSFMNYFGRGIYDDACAKGSGGCEQEYILYGHDNDTDNLSDTVKALTGIRTGLNLVYLYSDSTHRQSAMELALQITGALGLSPLALVMQFFILSTWALGQAVMDVRHLLAGGKVPFLHDDETFTLTIEGLLRLSSDTIADEDSGTDETGLSYSDYLMILLFSGHNSAMDYRCMDVIYLDLKAAQSDFCMDYLAYSLSARVELYTAHLFSRFGIVRAFDSGSILTDGYSIGISTAYSY